MERLESVMYFKRIFTMEIKTVATKRNAYHEYHILETIEAGIVLLGSEVKSLREGKASLKEGYVLVKDGQAYLVGVHVKAYSHTGHTGHKPVRDRRLLLHRREIQKINQTLAEKGLTAVPLKLYFKRGWLKVKIGLAKGKKLYDKRETKKKRDVERDIQRALSDTR